VIYDFKITPSWGFHPFWIRTQPSLGVENAFKGVLNQTNGRYLGITNLLLII
jgi:hypothetical protein